MTGMPAEAKDMVMPPPMVPAPSTAIFSMGRAFTSLVTPGTLAASRSAKKAWRWAFDSSPETRSRKNSRSAFMPSANGRVTAFFTAWALTAGAFSPRERRRSLAAASSKAAMSVAGASIFESGRSGALSATSFWAKATAPSTRSPSMISSMAPISLAFLAGIGSPVTMGPRAATAPIRRGRRWVPPAPGSRPSLTSGRPILAVGEATR